MNRNEKILNSSVLIVNLIFIFSILKGHTSTIIAHNYMLYGIYAVSFALVAIKSFKQKKILFTAQLSLSLILITILTFG